MGVPGPPVWVIIQDVESIKEQAKMVYLLESLQQTPPPILIRAENANVGAIHKHLLLKGVEAMAIHGAKKDQKELTHTIRTFREGEKDVAMDGVSKDLDFPATQHVINSDMPEDIKHYKHHNIHTGCSGNMGIVTTFISESVLMDLKALLMGAKKMISVLQELHCRDESLLDTGRECDCASRSPNVINKLETMQTKQVSNVSRSTDS